MTLRLRTTNGLGQDLPLTSGSRTDLALQLANTQATSWIVQDAARRAAMASPSTAGGTGAGSLNTQFLGFAERNMIWIMGGVLGFVLLMYLMGGGRR